MVPSRRLRLERELPELRERMACPQPSPRPRRRRARRSHLVARELADVAKLAALLAESERAMRRERYVSAFAGCRTSFALLLEHSKYMLDDGVRVRTNGAPATIAFNRPTTGTRAARP